MTSTERRPEPGSRPTAWVLAAPGAGDNGQLRTLVQLLEAEARWVDQVDPVSRVLRDRFTSFRAREIPRDKRALYQPPWPDLVLIAGGRAVIDACRIRQASGGRTKVICVGRPWAPLHWFDLVVTTPQYRLPEADNVITLDLPLNAPPRASDDDLRRWRGELEGLPRPMLGVILGGDSGSYRFDAGSAEDLARSINGIAGQRGGSAVVVGSPRTPQKAIEDLARSLEVPARILPWAPQGSNPYASVLQLADALLVTGDSASMLAEACHAGKPVAVHGLRERARSRLNRKIRAMTPMLAGVTARLTSLGLWVPARDMSELHDRTADSGWLSDGPELLSETSRIARPETSLAEVRERVYAVLDR